MRVIYGQALLIVMLDADKHAPLQSGQQPALLEQHLTCVSKSPSVSMSCVAWDHGQSEPLTT